MCGVFGGDEEQIETHDSPSGEAFHYKSNATPFTGRFSFFHFSQLMRAIVVEGTSKKDLILSIEDGDWVRFNFALSINISMDHIQKSPVQVTSPSWRIIDHPADKITREVLASGSEAKWLTIICKHELIQKLTGRSLDDLPKFFRFVDADQERSSRHRDFILRSRFASITTDIIRNEVDTALQIAYLESRCTELLCLALEDLIDPIDSDGLPALSSAEMERIMIAKSHIDEHFLDAPTVKDIASVAGVNRNSLFYGFKSKFGVSVSEYIHTRKLEHAKMLIEHGDQNLLDIAEQTGFRHQSSFITAFRKHYGVTPGKLRRQS
ncbi:MAG: AraC family transcriptional regulator [Pseudomonadota bacterium]